MAIVRVYSNGVDDAVRTYYVEAEEICQWCGGTGVIQHPAWALYWEENHGKSLPTPEDDERWFREWGWDEIPNEEIQCSNCDGAGVVRHRVSLAEALKDLEVRHGGHRN